MALVAAGGTLQADPEFVLKVLGCQPLLRTESFEDVAWSSEGPQVAAIVFCKLQRRALQTTQHLSLAVKRCAVPVTTLWKQTGTAHGPDKSNSCQMPLPKKLLHTLHPQWTLDQLVCSHGKR